MKTRGVNEAASATSEALEMPWKKAQFEIIFACRQKGHRARKPPSGMVKQYPAERKAESTAGLDLAMDGKGGHK